MMHHVSGPADGPLLPSASYRGSLPSAPPDRASARLGVAAQLLKGLVATRKAPLRLVVTSATLDGEKFCKYFGACPMITVPGRVHPVEVLHSTEKPKDYADAAVETAMDIHCDCGEGDILVFLTGQHEIEKACRKLRALVEATPEGAAGPVVPLPLYAALPPDAQARVFAPAPPGVRRCIFATNIAETSVTVDGVVYVVDAGMSKQKRYDAATGMDALDVELISRVQATQRAGRAGRTRPGKCFRLYPEKTFEREMPAATSPEIQRMSLVGAALYLKSLPLDIDLLAFDFLDRPTDAQWHDALRQLYALEAIDARGRITPVGKQMAALPVGPSLARALIAALDLGCLDEMVAVAAMLSADNVFLGSRGPDVRARPAGDSRGGFATDGGREVLQGLIAEKQGDHVLLLRLWEAWASHGFAQAYVKDLGLDPRGMKAARDVHRQLRTIVGHDGTRLREMLAQGRRHEAPPGRDGTRRTGGGASRETSPSQWSDHTRFTRDTRDTRDSDGGGMRRDASVHSQLHKQQQQQQQQPVGTQERGTFSGNVRAVRRAVCLGFANKLAKRAPLHNGYRTVGDRGQLAQLHPGCCTVEEDERGLLPSWVVYHEHVAGQRCHLTTVSPVEDDWVADILPRLRDVDVRMLSGGETTQKAQEEAAAQERAAEAQRAEQAKRRNTGETVDAARARYLARKQARGK
ncbi:unnamed protein product [Pedinophyceae sp. YPF-701]|nr:unnamed protein product [Pedinophyceae sp. YPF-701]